MSRHSSQWAVFPQPIPLLAILISIAVAGCSRNQPPAKSQPVAVPSKPVAAKSVTPVAVKPSAPKGKQKSGAPAHPAKADKPAATAIPKEDLLRLVLFAPGGPVIID